MLPSQTMASASLIRHRLPVAKLRITGKRSYGLLLLVYHNPAQQI